tara:strand:+ start:2138 stop:2503 length:366 start_codon:yes stop_codon:yes gene_type:complete
MKYLKYNWKLFHKIINYSNAGLIVLIFIFSSISLRSQWEWTKFYSNMKDLRNKNNNLEDYISKTEEYFLNEIELKDDIKNTNPEDLIYLVKTKSHYQNNFLLLGFKEVLKGFKAGEYQSGY